MSGSRRRSFKGKHFEKAADAEMHPRNKREIQNEQSKKASMQNEAKSDKSMNREQRQDGPQNDTNRLKTRDSNGRKSTNW